MKGQISETRPKVVVVGAGFAGLQVARALRQAPADILVIDRNNYHTFQPLLYQVATAALDEGEVAHQVRALLRRQPNTDFRQGTVWSIDWEDRLVRLEDGAALHFDYLAVTAGAVYDDFGVPGVKEHAFVLKSLEDAVGLRSHILRRFELANAEPALVDEGALTFVIAGGGPTGVELAGALAELTRRVLPGDYPNLDVERARVVLLEAQPALLSLYGKRSSRFAQRALERRGVEVRLGEVVQGLRPGEVRLGGSGCIRSHTVIWAAGVRAHPLAEVMDVELTRGCRIKVADDLSLPHKPWAFIAGDLAGAVDASGRLYPQTAPVAMQQGAHVGRQILQLLRGQQAQAFRYHDKGAMAIIGRSAGVAEAPGRLGGLAARGLAGWLAWGLVHLFYLPGRRNRLAAFMDWVYNYLTWDRHARLITGQAQPMGRNLESGAWFSAGEQHAAGASCARMDELDKAA